MVLTDADIKEFQKLYVEHFQTQLTDNVAREKLTKLVRQMELVYRPVSAHQVKALTSKGAKHDHTG